MGERVFRKDDGLTVHTLVFPHGANTARSTFVSCGSKTGYGCTWSLDEIERGEGGGYVEVLPEPPSTELTALREFYNAIKTSFADPCKRNYQLDFQLAFDRVQAAMKQEQTNV